MMWPKFVLNLLVLLVGIHFVLSTNVDKCTNGVPTPVVDIKGCEKPPCVLYTGTDAEMILSFNSTEYFSKLQLKVLAKVGPITIPYPLPSEVGDVCLNLLNTHCPLEENEPGVFRLAMPIEEKYPEINLRLTFTIEGEGRKKVACFAVDCKVVKE